MQPRYNFSKLITLDNTIYRVSQKRRVRTYLSISQNIFPVRSCNYDSHVLLKAVATQNPGQLIKYFWKNDPKRKRCCRQLFCALWSEWVHLFIHWTRVQQSGLINLFIQNNKRCIVILTCLVPVESYATPLPSNTKQVPISSNIRELWRHYKARPLECFINGWILVLL